MDIKITNKLDGYFSKFKPVFFKKKETLIIIADDPGGVFYLKEGFVKMNTVLSNGNELTLNIFKPGSLFPMFWALGEVPNNYAFEAMTPVISYKTSRKDMYDFLKDNPDVAFDLIKRILSGVDGLLTNYNHLLIGNADTRVASALLIAAKRFGDARSDGKIIIKLKLTHQDIANLAGISRETASITIERLKNEKILKQIRRFFVIYDMDKLYKKTEIMGDNVQSSTVL